MDHVESDLRNMDVKKMENKSFLRKRMGAFMREAKAKLKGCSAE
jgi:hypothetical protein